jgi:hypothetical protein
MKKRNELFENCQKTQKSITEIAIRNQQNYVSQASKKLKLLESQTLSGDQDEHTSTYVDDITFTTLAIVLI